MIGQNEIQLNEATMKLALEMYLDYIFNEEHGKNKVLSIETHFDGHTIKFEKIKKEEKTEDRVCL